MREAAPLWLLLDIGNTHTVAGLVDPKRGLRSTDLSSDLIQVRFRTDSGATADEYRSHLTQLFSTGPSRLPMDFMGRVERVILSTVVPALESVVIQACGKASVLSIHHDTRREFELALPYPHQMGADRLANVAGALTIAQAPFLIVDAGTATTFCLVDSQRRYIGGAISPGMEISWKALQSKAAKLFSVELTHPASALGNTTETQIQSGLLYGYSGMIEAMTDRLLVEARKLGNFENPTFLATGGITQLVKLSSRFRHEPDLTLIGLHRYGELTQ